MDMLMMFLIALALGFFYFLPTIIAFYRDHHYQWVIFGINFVLGLTGLGYVIAFVWAVWPKQTGLIDVVANDPTTNSPTAGQKIFRQLGQNVNAYRQGRDGAQTPALFCSKCGARQHGLVSFCGQCGHRQA